MSYNELIDGVIEYIQVSNQEAIKCKCKQAVYGLPTDFNKWGKAELKKMAIGNEWSSSYFDTVLLVAVNSNQLTADGTDYTAQAKEAQAALTRIKPKNMTFETFYNTIIDVGVETKDVRKAHRMQLEEELKKKKDEGKLDKGAVPRLKASGNSQGSIIMPKGMENLGIMPERDFDQQTALTMLDAHAVKMDAAHDLKKPLETLVTDAVKGIKSSITLAA